MTIPKKSLQLVILVLLIALAAVAPPALASVADPAGTTAQPCSSFAPAQQAKLNTTLTLQYSYVGSYPIPMNNTIGIVGRLTPEINGTGTLYWSIEGSGYVYQREATFVNGRHESSFNYTAPGGWCFKLVFNGDGSYNSAESGDVCMSVVGERQGATLTIAASTANLTVGSNVTLSGTISPSVTGTIYLYRSFNGSAFTQLTTAWASGGSYSYNATLADAGTYSFYASWSGNAAYNPATSNTVSAVAHGSVQPAQPAGTDNTTLIVAGIAIAAAVAAALLFFLRRKR